MALDFATGYCIGYLATDCGMAFDPSEFRVQTFANHNGVSSGSFEPPTSSVFTLQSFPRCFWASFDPLVSRLSLIQVLLLSVDF
ncbi:hypothetical protein P152DRAFT_19781 [Eremomyces bilateralis CBS 781.70]|uniref:Uncharacterized protein n=1 Tax=Eremomyces bilateralis CBS 781.70 TaxID=1392243 RepID=A0A6G1GHJ9_9PEZI|nr:uncharacterized protein P152DRAFT_19781 [Eremomyces bilateralis CBS 781.70]KAF1817462.1 hypothetical protein P152DRAFT_19781 [Eremomyces bilateralis CBS 781.70]